MSLEEPLLKEAGRVGEPCLPGTINSIEVSGTRDRGTCLGTGVRRTTNSLPRNGSLLNSEGTASTSMAPKVVSWKTQLKALA